MGLISVELALHLTSLYGREICLYVAEHVMKDQRDYIPTTLVSKTRFQLLPKWNCYVHSCHVLIIDGNTLLSVFYQYYFVNVR